MNDPRPAGQDRRELGITGPPATPATKVGRWFNLGFFSFFLVTLVVNAIKETVLWQPAALALWPLIAVPAVVLFYCWRYYLPQRAWLEGTVLVVQDRTGTRRCDLAYAKDMAWGFDFSIRHLKDEPAPPVLVVRDGGVRRTVRFVLRGRRGGDLVREDLLLLADAIETRPRTARDDPQALGIARALRGGPHSWADHQDWTHRT